MASTACGVCAENEPKYKCPHCSLRYCSVKCFKQHVPSHADDEANTDDNNKPVTSSAASVPTNALPNSIDDANSEDIELHSDSPDPDPSTRRNHPFEAVLRDPRFKPLFIKYPNLTFQLQNIDEMTWSPSKFPPLNPDEVAEGKHPKHASPYVKGKWDQEKADKVAVKQLSRLSHEDEGVMEFVTLCNLVINPDPPQEANTDSGMQLVPPNPFG